MKVPFPYPGDPVSEADFMFGREFVESHQGREIVVQVAGAPDVRVPVDDVVCDLCNDGIGPLDPCVLVDDSRLYCWKCAAEWVVPHVRSLQRDEADVIGR